MNDKRNLFSKKERPKILKGQADKPLSQRLTEFRTSNRENDQGELVNRFGDVSGAAERRHEGQFTVDTTNATVTPWEKAGRESVQRSVGGMRLTPELIALRDRMQQAKQDAKSGQVTQSRLQTLASFVGPDESGVIFSAWLERHPDLYPSEFNCQQILEAWTLCMERGADGITGFNFTSLDVILAELVKGNHIEKRQRFRGDAPVTPWTPPPSASTPEAPARTKTATVWRDVDTEGQDPRTMDFDSLTQAVRGTYQSPTSSSPRESKREGKP